MRIELETLLASYPKTCHWLEEMLNYPCGKIVVHNFEREVILEGGYGSGYLIPFFEKIEDELSKGFNGSDQELFILAAQDGNLFLKGRKITAIDRVANVATASRAGQFVAGTSSARISNYGQIAIDICEGKKAQPKVPIVIPSLYNGFMWVAKESELQKELDTNCPNRDDETVLDILSRPRFRNGWAVQVLYPSNIPNIELHSPTVIDSIGHPLWRKCSDTDNWGRTVAMHDDYKDGVSEAVHAVPCILPIGVNLSKVGECNPNRQVDVDSICDQLFQKMFEHSAI